MMAEIVYILCALTSLLCAIALLRQYAHSRVRLLLWTGFCFAGLALNNILLFFDMIVVPEMDLSVLRSIPPLLGLAAMIYGFMEDAP